MMAGGAECVALFRHSIPVVISSDLVVQVQVQAQVQVLASRVATSIA